MGMTGAAPVRAWLRRRWYLWSWRARYWWLDTHRGRVARLALFGACCLVAVLLLARAMILVATAPAGPAQPLQAAAWWVQIAIMIAFAAISFLLRPKVEGPKPQEAQVPTVEDGLAAREVFGTVWIDDPFFLAWKMTGTQKIRKKGGKK